MRNGPNSSPNQNVPSGARRNASMSKSAPVSRRPALIEGSTAIGAPPPVGVPGYAAPSATIGHEIFFHGSRSVMKLSGVNSLSSSPV
jgi:hypothetical protein